MDLIARELPERWTVAHGALRFELKRTDFGHLGLFPEQAENWEWIADALSPRPLGEGQGEGEESGRSQNGEGHECLALTPCPSPGTDRRLVGRGESN